MKVETKIAIINWCLLGIVLTHVWIIMNLQKQIDFLVQMNTIQVKALSQHIENCSTMKGLK